MTATPRLYTEGAKSKAAQHAVDVFSMDDERTYGPQFHRLPFSRAVDQGLQLRLQGRGAGDVGGARQSRATVPPGVERRRDQPRRRGEIFGCWRALQNPENRPADDGPIRRLAAVWGVLRALRSHDDRFDAEINQIDLNEAPTDRLVIIDDRDDRDDRDPARRTLALRRGGEAMPARRTGTIIN